MYNLCISIYIYIFQVVLAIVFLIPADIGTLIDFVAFLMWIFYGMAFVTVIIFRYKKHYKDLPRPVRVI